MTYVDEAEVLPGEVAAVERNASEIGELLHVPERWVRENTRSGLLPCVQLGRYRRYRRDAVLAWVDAQESGGAAMAEAEAAERAVTDERSIQVSIAISPHGDWKCPCGDEETAEHPDRPVQVVNAIREPLCRFCGRKQEDQYRRYPSVATRPREPQRREAP